MTSVQREIAAQPTAWRRAESVLPGVRDALPSAGERVAVVGCGTSWFVAQSYASLRELSGQGETDAFPASELPAGRRYDRVLAISRSGTTTEVLRALRQTACPTTAITSETATPMSTVASTTIALDFAAEASVVQTVFATTTLMLLRLSLGEDIGVAVDQTERVLSNPLVGIPADTEQFTFLGQGWAYGLAREAALKMREAAQLWTEAYVQMEYRHGPIAIAEPGRVVWIVGSPVDGLIDQVRGTGATVVCDDLDPVADLVRVQLLATRRAAERGLDPDHPRNLSRSVLLGDTASLAGDAASS